MCKIELMIKERTNRFYKVEKKILRQEKKEQIFGPAASCAGRPVSDECDKYNLWSEVMDKCRLPEDSGQSSAHNWNKNASSCL